MIVMMIPIRTNARRGGRGHHDKEALTEKLPMSGPSHPLVPVASNARANGPNGPESLDHQRPKAEEMAADGHLRSRVIKRSIVVAGHKTSVSLEDVFWNGLREIAHHRGLHLSQLVGSIDAERQHGNLSSAIRLFVFEHGRTNSAGDTQGRTEPVHAGPEVTGPRRP
jgi:predicted DNA-binding ribbon-helix-helix protein